jgi:hypothetical protein
MLSIRPDSTNDSPAGEASPETGVPEAPPQMEAPKKPMPLIWVPATLGLGLLIALVYLGGRILTAKSHTSPAARQAMSAPKTPAISPAAPKEPVIAKTPEPVLQAKAVPAVAPVPEVKPVIEAKPETKPVATPAAEIKPVPQAKPVVEAKPTQEVKSIANAASDADLPLITPQTGQRYIQIGALGPKATRRYLDEMRRGNLDPHAAPGPSPDLIRVLVGPFRDRDSLGTVQAQLDAAGIPNFIRAY